VENAAAQSASFFLTALRLALFAISATPTSAQSMRTEGSISVERVAKPLKNKVWTKERSRMAPEKAALLLRAGINLRFLHDAKSKLK